MRIVTHTHLHNYIKDSGTGKQENYLHLQNLKYFCRVGRKLKLQTQRSYVCLHFASLCLPFHSKCNSYLLARFMSVLFIVQSPEAPCPVCLFQCVCVRVVKITLQTERDRSLTTTHPNLTPELHR